MVAERYRGAPRLNMNPETGESLCISCNLCVAASRSPRKKSGRRCRETRRQNPRRAVRLRRRYPPCWKVHTGKIHAGWGRMGCASAGSVTAAGSVATGRKVVRIESVLVVNLALVAQDFVGF